MPSSEHPEHGREAALHELVDALTASPNARTLPSSPSLCAGASPCAVCRLVARSVEREMRLFFAEFVNDPQTREGWRRARGFCAEHAALAATLGDSLAVAILYADLARITRERRRHGETGTRQGGLRRLARRLDAPCPTCTAAQAATERYVAALAAGLEEEDVWTALSVSHGLCVAHAEQTAAAAKPASAARLRQWEVERLAALQAELEEIIRKNDYRFRGEAWGEEKDAWLRALLLLMRP